jgi:hypothetical protein
MEVWVHAFLTSALDGGEVSDSSPSHFTLGKEIRYPLDRGYVGPKVGVNVMEKK